jgi:hypothetical protein
VKLDWPGDVANVNGVEDVVNRPSNFQHTLALPTTRTRIQKTQENAVLLTAMGAIHSNSSRDEERNAQDLRKAQKLAEKLFDMDTTRSPAEKHGPAKPHKVGGSHISPANRRSILRIFESMHRENEKRDGRSDDVTANSTCDNSPVFSPPSRPSSKEVNKDLQFGNSQQPSQLQSSGSRRSLRRNSFDQSCSIHNSGGDLRVDPSATNTEHFHANSPVVNCTRSRRIPVKGCRVGPVMSSSGSHFHFESCEDMDEDNPDLHLKHIYDLRTWEMYLRITESRKNKPLKKSVHIPTAQVAPIPHVNGGFPLWQQPGVCVNALEHQDSYTMDLLPPWLNVPEHEMIFGDLDE